MKQEVGLSPLHRYGCGYLRGPSGRLRSLRGPGPSRRLRWLQNQVHEEEGGGEATGSFLSIGTVNTPPS